VEQCQKRGQPVSVAQRRRLHLLRAPATRSARRSTWTISVHLRPPVPRGTPIGRPTPAGSRRAATARRPVSCGGRHRLSPPHPGRDHRRQRPLRVTSVRSHASRGSVWAPFPDRGANRTGPDGGGGTAHTRGAGHSAASGPAYEAATSDTGPGVAAVSSVPTPQAAGAPPLERQHAPYHDRLNRRLDRGWPPAECEDRAVPRPSPRAPVPG
jgi:hypothetical protein